MRLLAWGGVIAPLLLTTVAVLGAALRPDYDHLHHFISELGATGTPRAWIMNYLGFVPVGVCIVLFAASLGARLPRHPSSALGTLLLVLFGAGTVASGFASCDVGCPQAGGSLENRVHDSVAPLAFLAGSIGTIVLGARFRGVPGLCTLRAYSIASGLLALALFGALASTLETRQLTGLWQRLLVAVLFGWCAVVALRLLREDPAAPVRAPTRR